mmetsp:Transcript_139781/g.243333  ORF Transcript_139781/g.243333 Transcript_139781/m.243333 type:complete len:279 (-) Transcript_139781:40-876(-)
MCEELGLLRRRKKVKRQRTNDNATERPTSEANPVFTLPTAAEPPASNIELLKVLKTGEGLRPTPPSQKLVQLGHPGAPPAPAPGYAGAHPSSPTKPHQQFPGQLQGMNALGSVMARATPAQSHTHSASQPSVHPHPQALKTPPNAAPTPLGAAGSRGRAWTGAQPLPQGVHQSPVPVGSMGPGRTGLPVGISAGAVPGAKGGRSAVPMTEGMQAAALAQAQQYEASKPMLNMPYLNLPGGMAPASLPSQQQLQQQLQQQKHLQQQQMGTMPHSPTAPN